MFDADGNELYSIESFELLLGTMLKLLVSGLDCPFTLDNYKSIVESIKPGKYILEVGDIREVEIDKTEVQNEK